LSGTKAIKGISGNLGLNRKTSAGDFNYRLDDGSVRRMYNNQTEANSGITGLNHSAGNSRIETGVYYDETRRGIPGLIYDLPTPEASLASKRLSGRIGFRGDYRDVNFTATGFLSAYSSHYRSPREQFDPISGETIILFPEDNRQEGKRYGITSEASRTFAHLVLKFNYAYQHDNYSGEDLLRSRSALGGVGLGEAERDRHRASIDSRLWGSTGWLTWHINPSFGLDFISDRGNSAYETTTPSLYVAVEKSYRLFNISLNAGWGRSLSAPPFNALFLTENSFAVGNKDLKPERGELVSFGLSLSSDYTVGSTWRMNILRTIQQTSDLIVWRRNYFGKYYPDNIARVMAKGIEISATAELLNDFILLSGVYIYSDSRNDAPGNFYYGNQTPLAPRHSGNASLTLNKYQWLLHLSGRWIGRRYSTESNLDPLSTAGMGLPSYAVCDLQITRAFKLSKFQIEVGLGVDNLTNASYRVIERSPMPGRMWTGRMIFQLD
jgi:hypothetical protein